MAAVTICSDFGAQENKMSHCLHRSTLSCCKIHIPIPLHPGWLLNMIQSPSDTQPSLRPWELSVCSPGIQSALQGPSWCPFGCPPSPGQDLNLSGGLLAAAHWTPPGSQLARCSGCSVSLLWSLWPPQSQHHPGLSWPFCSKSSRHLPGFLSVSLQLMWVRGHGHSQIGDPRSGICR